MARTLDKVIEMILNVGDDKIDRPSCQTTLDCFQALIQSYVFTARMTLS